MALHGSSLGHESSRNALLGTACERRPTDESDTNVSTDKDDRDTTFAERVERCRTEVATGERRPVRCRNRSSASQSSTLSVVALNELVTKTSHTPVSPSRKAPSSHGQPSGVTAPEDEGSQGPPGGAARVPRRQDDVPADEPMTERSLRRAASTTRPDREKEPGPLGRRWLAPAPLKRRFASDPQNECA
jgi:hypothetical protein